MNYDKLTEKKRRLDQYYPLPSALMRNLEEWFLVELTYTSNAIEGNTLTRQETALVVEKGLTVGGKSLVEHLEATNHAQALVWIRDKVGSELKDLNEKSILHIHNIILKSVDDANAGKYRDVSVRISGSNIILPNPRKVPELMQEFCNWLNKSCDLHPALLAAEAHYRLVTIHPFVDGNGRTARLLMNMILLMRGYPAAIIRKRDRLSYINALEKAQLGGSKDQYLELIFKAVDRSFDIYLKAAKGETASRVDAVILLKIGELAKQVGESNSTIRHWTKEGLLEIAEITSAGYGLYAPEMIKRIRKIHALKEKRYTLLEIKEML